MTSDRGRDPFEVVALPSWVQLRRRLPRLLVGIVLLGMGIGLIVRARLGVSPWDVFHQGIASRLGWSLGAVITAVGVVVLLAWIPLRQRMGIGTIVNTLVVGLVANATLRAIGTQQTETWRWVLLLAGTLVISLGTALYIGAGLGPGPRDGLMTAIAARGVPLWVVRTVLELTVLLAGWALGGNVGVGTVLFAFAVGPLAHVFFAWIPPPGPTIDLGPGVAGD
ncbi:MAG: hypothetical protein U0V73_15245 [Acidimicrobiia bacterium]